MMLKQLCIAVCLATVPANETKEPRQDTSNRPRMLVVAPSTKTINVGDEFFVAVPDGLLPGDYLNATYLNHSLIMVVPEGAAAGTEIHVHAVPAHDDDADASDDADDADDADINDDDGDAQRQLGAIRRSFRRTARRTARRVDRRHDSGTAAIVAGTAVVAEAAIAAPV
jgi:hypothetical protein